ncbi:MAG: hypothetical protein L0191_04185 [Acidobacteria bacterium]|nr:hypothetical protein [Acidobacteriota bacterium]
MLLSPGRAQAAEKWEWDITPYLWASGVRLDVSVDGDPVLGADASFSELLDDLDVAGMLHFEGRHGKAGFFTDAIFISLSDDQTRSADPPLPGDTQTDAELELGIYEAGGFYRPGGKEFGFDFLYGLRFLDYDQDLSVTIPPPVSATTSAETSSLYTDGIVGVRYSLPMSKRWYFAIRGDVGAGGTQIEWNGIATFGFTCDKKGRYAIRGGYRYFKVELDEEDNDVDVESDVTLQGPYIGFAFRF